MVPFSPACRRQRGLASGNPVAGLQKLHRYDSRWRFATWLFVIARRVSINHHQRFRVPADSAAIQSVPSPARQPDQIVADAESGNRLWELARQALTEEEVTALWLHYVEDLPTHEIAAVLGRSRVSVKTMMFRARKRLRPVLRPPSVSIHRTPPEIPSRRRSPSFLSEE